jgi:hypothetical protein
MENTPNGDAAAEQRRDFIQGLHQALAEWFDRLVQGGDFVGGPLELDLLMLVGKLHEYLHSLDENYLGFTLPECPEWFVNASLTDEQRVVYGPW